MLKKKEITELEKTKLLQEKIVLQKNKNESSRGFITFIISILSLTLVFFQYKLTSNQKELMQKQTELMDKQTEIQDKQLKIELERSLPHFTVSHRYIRDRNNEIIGDGLYITKDDNYAQDVQYYSFALVSTKQLIQNANPCVYFGLSNYYSRLEHNDISALFSSEDNLALIKQADNIIAGKKYKSNRLESLFVENYVLISFLDVNNISMSYYFKSNILSTVRISEDEYHNAENLFSKNDIGGIDTLCENVSFWVKKNCVK